MSKEREEKNKHTGKKVWKSEAWRRRDNFNSKLKVKEETTSNVE
jgi:hypothetical protein